LGSSHRRLRQFWLPGDLRAVVLLSPNPPAPLQPAAMDVRTFVNGKIQPGCVAAKPRWEDWGPSTPRKSRPAPCETTPAKEGRTGASAEGPKQLSLEALVASRAFLALSLPHCPQCDELGACLAARGVPSSVFVKWDKADPQYPALKKALSAHAGESFTFPQVFADGAYQGGFREVMLKAERGAFDGLFEREFGVAPATVRRWAEQRPMAVFSLQQCPQCDVLRSRLEERGLPVGEIFVKLDKAAPEYQSLKAQLVEMTGVSQFAFPQTFVHAEHQGGFEEVAAKLDAGHLDCFFAAAFGVAPPAPSAPAPQAAMEFDDDF